MKEKSPRGKGRPRQNQDGTKIMRCYTIDAALIAFVDSLPDGLRSQYVSDAIREKLAREKQP